LQERKESKIGVSVNPDDANNLGKIHVGLVAAKDLVKTDKLSKSDPYAILSHGNQKFKTDTVKNTQNPEFNYEAEFNVPDSGDGTIKVKLFDADRLGKDKPLGSAVLDVEKVMGAGAVPADWYPLQGVKSGQVLMAAEFEPSEAAASRLGSPDRRLAGQSRRRRSGRRVFFTLTFCRPETFQSQIWSENPTHMLRLVLVIRFSKQKLIKTHRIHSGTSAPTLSLMTTLLLTLFWMYWTRTSLARTNPLEVPSCQWMNCWSGTGRPALSGFRSPAPALLRSKSTQTSSRVKTPTAGCPDTA